MRLPGRTLRAECTSSAEHWALQFTARAPGCGWNEAIASGVRQLERPLDVPGGLDDDV